MSIARNSTVAAVAVALFVSASACGDDTVVVTEDPWVGHYSWNQPDEARTWFSHYEIRPDNRVIVWHEDSCGEYVEEPEVYAWEVVSDDEIIIQALDGGWIWGQYKYNVTRGNSCNHLFVQQFTPDFEHPRSSWFRGRLCLEWRGGVCFTAWCDEPPAPCEETETSG